MRRWLSCHFLIPNSEAADGGVATTPRRSRVSAPPRRWIPELFSRPVLPGCVTHWRRGVADTFCAGAAQLRTAGSEFGLSTTGGLRERRLTWRDATRSPSGKKDGVRTPRNGSHFAPLNRSTEHGSASRLKQKRTERCSALRGFRFMGWRQKLWRGWVVASNHLNWYQASVRFPKQACRACRIWLASNSSRAQRRKFSRYFWRGSGSARAASSCSAKVSTLVVLEEQPTS